MSARYLRLATFDPHWSPAACAVRNYPLVSRSLFSSVALISRLLICVLNGISHRLVVQRFVDTGWGAVRVGANRTVMPRNYDSVRDSYDATG